MTFELKPRTPEGRASIDAASAALPTLTKNAAEADLLRTVSTLEFR